ncbi:MAG: S-adenosyl-L-methionine-binding protein [Dehalococcoidia bacterium]|nr:S-adenosyl-L-methionine-binding protein [Dehalococcoidia bacterium]
MEFQIKSLAAMDVAWKNYQGPDAEIGRAFNEVYSWVRMRGLLFGGPLVAVYFDEPVKNQRTEVNAEVWVPFLGDPELGSSMNTRYLPPHRVAYTIHRGDIRNIHTTEEALFDWITSQNLQCRPGYRRHVYLKRGDAKNHASWETEIQVPLL